MTLRELIAQLEAAIAGGIPEDSVVARMEHMRYAAEAFVIPSAGNEVQIFGARNEHAAEALRARAERAKGRTP